MDYDIGKAFEVIERELMESMIRNLRRHRAEEEKEDKQWTMWQVEQLKALEEYKKRNQEKYGKQFKNINKQIEVLLQKAREDGNMDQEIKILEAIKKGLKAKRIPKGASAEFFKINDRKLDALIKATVQDMQKAETAVLRMANDQYRKIIFNAQVYANTGAGTYEQAIDMATKDFLAAGINCIEYANGSRHNIKEYARMAIRTAEKRAYLQGEGEMRQSWGIHTVIVNKRGNPCPKCLPFCGKVLIDDVWSGGNGDGISSATGLKYPLMSQAVATGLYHPNCKDSHTTYFEGISTPPDDTYSKEEINQIYEDYQKSQKQQYAKRQAEKFGRLAKFSLDEENQKRYAARREEWKRRHSEFVLDGNPVIEKVEDNLKSEIKKAREEKGELQGKIHNLENEEKTLTKKVYFDMTGTKTDMEKLRTVSKNKQMLLDQVKELEEHILNRQEIYKSEAETRILKDGVLKEIKLSKRMTPESVDMIESTLYHLKEKYGIMPKGVIFSPVKVPDGTASYDWLDDKLYLSNYFTDLDRYLDIVQKSEKSLGEYRKHYHIKEKVMERIEKAETILSDRSVKGYARNEAILEKARAEIELNISRQAVRENLSDVLIHEYGHFVHRHANTDYVQKKNVFGMKNLGGKMVGGDWKYEINTVYSRSGKIEASKVSKYATENPYETFAEGFLAMEKGEKIPDNIEKVVSEAIEKVTGKQIVKNADFDIMVSGARIIDPDGDEAEKFAKMYYDEIRSFSTDVRKISANLGKNEKEIMQIKAYLFENDFDPDCAIAQSWQRLMIGKDIKPHDRTLIEHELLEMQIKQENPGIEHWKAHEIATQKYNYQKEAKEYYGNLEKHKKNSK